MRYSSYKTGKTCRDTDILKDKKACYTRDKNDIKVCDLVFVNVIGAPARISMGTNIEVGITKAYDKPVICASDYCGEYDKDLLFSASVDLMYYDLDIALKRCVEFLLP